VKKKILAIMAAIAVIGVACVQVIPAIAQTNNPIDHVVINPSSTTLEMGFTQKFSAQAYDVNDQPVSNVNYYWMVTKGGGIITETGVNTANFTAGNVAGVFNNTVQVIAVKDSLSKVAKADVTVTGTPGAFHHVTITPATATVAPGGTKQFNAQAYDVNNVALSGFVYTWGVINGGGSINATSGLFNAGTTVGVFNDTVQVTASKANTNYGIDKATVVVKQNVTPSPTPRIDRNRLMKMFNCYLKNFNFDDFLGGQWQVKDDGVVKTIKVIPGIVQATPTPSATSITIMPNGQTVTSAFTLPQNTVIRPKGATFAAKDKVVVVTVNDQVVMVIKVAPAITNQIPPGLRKQDDDKREGKRIPPGWSKGNKTGWSSVDNENNHESEEDGD